jgi:hypothetical protein
MVQDDDYGFGWVCFAPFLMKRYLQTNSHSPIQGIVGAIDDLVKLIAIDHTHELYN